MEDVLKELRSLSSDEIRQELVNRGETVGPAMPSMRHLFEKKLARRIMRDRGLEIEEEDGGRLLPEITVTKPVKEPNAVAMETDGVSQYYAVSLPQDLKGYHEPLVFSDRKEAMRAMKNIPGCRFKIFKDLDRARAFTKILAEDIVQSPRPATNVESKIPEKKEEKRSFKEPTRAERITLKSAVETGNIGSMTSLAWSNPHYLVTVGDTPVVLHEAFRYNALHLAAKFNQPDVCRHLLTIITTSDFHRLLYSDDSDTTRRNRIHHLLDLYLNMPDKGSGESALHFACKFGQHEVVEVLVSYPQCDKRFRNKTGCTPYDVVNQRASNPDPEVGDRIRKLLKGLVYVPLYRAMGNLPVVGHPVSEAELKDRTLRAYAGPMTPEQADKFYRSWAFFPPNSPQQKQREIRQTKRSDYDKGLERLGRNLAVEFDVCWFEYWDFLADFADLRTPEGLQLLEQYLITRAAHSNNSIGDESDLNGNSLTVEKMATATTVSSRDRCYGDVVQTPERSPIPKAASSPSDRQSPGEVSLLAVRFAKLKLNDSSHGKVKARKTLDYDDAPSDSDDDDDSDKFESAPSSPSSLLVVETAGNHGNKNESTSSFHSDDDDESGDEFKDAVEEVTINMLPCLRTPVQRLKSRDWNTRDSTRQSRDSFLDGCVPTKLDLDVWRAVGEISLKDDTYPHFSKWRRAVTSFSEKEQSQWPSPARLRRVDRPRLDSPLATPSKATICLDDLSSVKSKLEFD